MQLKVGDLVRIKASCGPVWGGQLAIVISREDARPSNTWFRKLSDGEEGYLRKCYLSEYIEIPEEQTP